MGILDFLTGNNAAASPWGALYQQPAQQTFLDYSMGFPVQTPASPWGDPSQSSVANPAAPPYPAPPANGFGAGASPFGFAGPGSMNVNPASIAAPAPIGPPAPAQVAQPATIAPPSTDLSSVNRPAPGAPAPAADDGEDAAPAAPVRPPVAPVVTGEPSPAAPFSLGGIGSHLSAGLASINNTNSGGVFGKLSNGLAGLITGQRTDPGGVTLQLQGQADNATARALIGKNVDPATVQAAVLAARAGDKTMLTTLVNQNFGPDKFQHVTVKDESGAETPGAFDPTTGKYTFGASPNGGSGNGAGFVTGPDGRPVAIPPGVNRKEFIKRVSEASADAATGKATESQAKASSFAARMTQAEGVLGGLQGQGLSLGNKVAGEIPIAGNYLQSTDYQRYKQASSAFITAMLRQESGAAINKSEFDRYEKELFPQPGDDASVVTQKAAQRAAAIQQMTRAAGPGFKGPAPAGTVNVGGQAINWSVK